MVSLVSIEQTMGDRIPFSLLHYITHTESKAKQSAEQSTLQKVMALAPPSNMLVSIFQFWTQALNAFLHLPYIYDLSWYIIWAIYILCAPLHLIPLLLMFLFDLFTGRLWTERYLEPEVG